MTTAGQAPGQAQANLIAIPRDWAYDFLLFTHRNPKPCPVLDVLDAGETVSALKRDADVRTHAPQYRIWENGELKAEPENATDYWRDDLVTFLIGCSFTFETALTNAGVPLRHVEQKKNVSMFVTDIQCRPAGRLHGPMVVSMRWIPESLVDIAHKVTALMPSVHGAPVGAGEPTMLGIRDIEVPDFGDAVEHEPGDVPVFWACGVTPQAVLMKSRPPFAITHAPGQMFVTDMPDFAYRVG